MEAIIRTENKTLFEAILEFLKKLNFTVETRSAVKHVSADVKKKNDFNEAVKFWKSFSIDMSNFKLDREGAYER